MNETLTQQESYGAAAKAPTAQLLAGKVDGLGVSSVGPASGCLTLDVPAVWLEGTLC